MKALLRIISILMFLVAVVFLGIALTHPELGTVFYIGNWRIGVEIWQTFYVIYVIVMLVLFLISCRIKK